MDAQRLLTELWPLPKKDSFFGPTELNCAHTNFKCHRQHHTQTLACQQDTHAQLPRANTNWQKQDANTNSPLKQSQYFFSYWTAVKLIQQPILLETP